MALWRRAQGEIVDGQQFVWVLAKILHSSKPLMEDTTAAERDQIHRMSIDDSRHGLDRLTLSRAIADADLGHFTDEEIMESVHAVNRWHEEHLKAGPISGEAIGRLLGLTALERREVKCWNVLAVDESKVERENRRAEQNRVATRERMRAMRGDRRSAHRIEAEKRRLFCEEHGIVERTLRRWIKEGNPRVQNRFDSDISEYRSQTKNGHPVRIDVGTPYPRATEPGSILPVDLSTLAVASQPGFVATSSEKNGVRPKPSWATEEGEGGILPSNQKEDGGSQASATGSGPVAAGRSETGHG